MWLLIYSCWAVKSFIMGLTLHFDLQILWIANSTALSSFLIHKFLLSLINHKNNGVSIRLFYVFNGNI